MSNADELARLLNEAGEQGTVVFTGAGVSTESGIPDFRSPGGIWSRYAPIDYQDFLNDAEMRRESWRRGLEVYADMSTALPNAAHEAIAEWWRSGLVLGVVTQNIDGLHHKAGMDRDSVIELHGNAHWVACLRCDTRFDRAAVHARVRAGEAEPDCPRCGGILKTTTVSFGQPLPSEAIREAERWHMRARLCLIVGSSLVVTPAALLPEQTLLSGGRLAIVNATPTHLDERAVLVAREPAAVLLEAARGRTNPR